MTGRQDVTGPSFSDGPLPTFSVSIDATSIGEPDLLLQRDRFGGPGVLQFPTAEAQLLQLEAGTYVLAKDKVGGAAAVVEFLVTPNGDVDYSPAFDLVFSGRGTTDLVVRGITYELDSSGLSYAFLNTGVGSFTRGLHSVTALPGPDVLSLGTGVQGRDGIRFVFQVLPDGTVRYDPSFEGFLAGSGTTRLSAVGVAIRVDASVLDYSSFILGSIASIANTGAHDLQLLPGPHWFRVNSGVPLLVDNPQFGFSVLHDGTVEYDAALDDVVLGHGTPTLVVSGWSIDVDARPLEGEATFAIVNTRQSFVATDVIQGFRLFPGTHRFASGTAAHVLDFTLTPGGTLDYDPALDHLLTGRGTTTLIVGAGDPRALLETLISRVVALELRRGLENSLSASLEAAAASLENDRPASIQQVESFIAKVEAQRGKALAEAEADDLIEEAHEIIELLQGA